MKNIRIKNFIIGVIVGMLIITAFPSLALTQAIDVIFDNYKISINGKIIESDVEPFVYNNRTVVPVRTIAEALGKDVEMNTVTNIVEINDKAVEEVIAPTATPSETAPTSTFESILPTPTPFPEEDWKAPKMTINDD